MNVREVRIVLAGCQKLAVDVLEFILQGNEAVGVDQDGYVLCPKLVGVITHDEERDRLFGDTLVTDFCNQHGIPSVRFDGKVDPDVVSAWEPDILFSIYYRKILPKEVVNMPPMGCVNIHPAQLPKDRGPNPTLWVVLRGDYSAFTTLHYIDEGMDTGDIIACQAEGINGKTGFEVNALMMDVGLNMFKKHYADIMCGRNGRKSQAHSHATCNAAFTNNMRYINWNQDASIIDNYVRAFAKPYAGAIARTKKGTEILIHKVRVLDVARSSLGPGSYEMTDKGLVVQTYSKPLLVEEFEGKSLKRGRFLIGAP